MLFNSLAFVVFLPLVFSIYWCFKNNNRYQNIIVLIASYCFYGWWDWRFLSLILFSTAVDFILGQLVYREKNDVIAKRYLWLSFFVNLGLLIVFKYFNFFISEFISLLEIIGFNTNLSTISIILPIGISFYTFQTLSYTIDIYKKQIVPTNNFIAFAAFVSFFPQLVAGPVERASSLLPQFLKKRIFSYQNAKDGCQQILWGFFKKVAIADNCALFVNDIYAYNNYDEVSGVILITGAILFVIQIYADFSGYSDIAIGVAKLFGFKLMQNFDFPYFATSITEFWRKWNISVSTWFRDYLNKPLLINLRNQGNKGIWLALFLTFALMGLWHGAGWHFIVYGMIHGIVMIIELITRKKRKKLKKKTPKKLFMVSAWLITMCIWTISLIFFRAENMFEATNYITSIFSNLLYFDSNQVTSRLIFKSAFITLGKGKILLVLICLMFIFEWFYRKYTYGLKLNFKYTIVNWVMYISILFLIIFFGEFNQQEFIYFQF